MAKRLFIILLFLGSAVVGTAQTHYFHNYQVNAGLSSNTVTCIFQDKKGFMWFGTRNGLNRFDGTFFKVFKNQRNNPQSIGDNSIFCIAEDDQERLWVGTYTGIYIFNPKLEQFTPFRKIPQGEIRYFKKDDKGDLWIAAGNAMYKIKTAFESVERVVMDGKDTYELYKTDDNKLWSLAGNGMIRSYNPATNVVKYYNINPGYNGKGKWLSPRNLCPVDDTAILVVADNEVLLLDIKTSKVRTVFGKLGNIGVNRIWRQAGNEYWLGTQDGICILDIGSNKKTYIRKQFGNPFAISDNSINDFYRDNEGGIWIATFFGGVNYYSQRLDAFTKYFPLPGTNSISGNIVHEICADKNNNLWIGTEDAGLNKLDLKTGRFTAFKPPHIAYHNIHGLLADGNELWIGTLEHGLDVMDLRTEKVIRHYSANSGTNSLLSNFIITIRKTREGDVLIGTWVGLFKYNRASDNFTSFPEYTMPIQAIHQDASGTLWIGTYGKGVYFFNKSTGIRGQFNQKAKKDYLLPSNYVNSLYEDRNGNIWICTESGLCKYEKATGRIITFDQVTPLGSVQVFKVLEDDAGMIWVSTTGGLVRLNPSSKENELYNSKNGLLSDQFNYNSAVKDNAGKLYFGTVMGMVSFQPSLMIKTKQQPALYITGIDVNNMEQKVYGEKSSLKMAPAYLQSLTLSHDSSSIGIQVAVLDYSFRSANEFMYKMEGVDKDWVLVKGSRKINYTKLSPGQYTFKVRSNGKEATAALKETVLNIHILPPIWATIWAYMLYLLLIGFIIWLILRYYYSALREKNARKIKVFEIEKEREVYNAKIEFFTNITHEIRTPLTMIKLPVEKLLKEDIQNDLIKENLVMINKNTDRLIYLTNQLLDFRKAEAHNYSLNFIRTNINDLLVELFGQYKMAAEDKGLSLKLEMPRVPLLASIDPEAFKKILTNLFSNAFKYAESQVHVKLLPFNSYDNIFHLEFRNDGVRIPPELKDKIFEPFYRLKETERIAGTGIGLALSRALTELHNGTLELKFSVDSMNLFLLSVPMHQENEMDMDTYEVTEAGSADNSISQNPPKNESIVFESTLLLVEDDRHILDFTEKELSTSFNILKATNGNDALEILNNESVQLVVSDIMMPVMDGIELCRKIKTDVHYSHIPVVLLTAKNSLTAKVEGFETGADAYIEKPFSMDHLKAQINSLLNNRNLVKEYYAHSPLAHIKGIANTKADVAFLEALQQAIDENITEKDMDVDMLSKKMHMSRRTLYRKINAISDMGPNELIILSRLKKAAELLADGRYKINEAANMVGYNLNSNFSRDFHRQFGISPSDYIKTLSKEA